MNRRLSRRNDAGVRTLGEFQEEAEQQLIDNTLVEEFDDTSF